MGTVENLCSALQTELVGLVDAQDASSIYNSVLVDFSENLVSASSWWGKTVNVVYGVSDGLFGSNSRPPERVQKAFAGIKKRFQEQVAPQLDKLDIDFQKECQNKDVHARVLAVGRALPLLFNVERPFVLQSHVAKIQLAFEEVIREPLFQKKQIDLLHRIQRAHAHVAVETILQMPLPHEAFKNILGRKTVTRAQEKALNAWTQEVEKYADRITPTMLHTAFEKVAELLFAKKSALKQLSYVQELELELLKKGFNFIRGYDAAYKAWVDSLQPFTTIAAPEPITLGAYVRNDMLEKEGYYLFESEKRTGMYLFATTPFLLHVWRASCQDDVYGIEPIRVIRKDPHGMYLVIEKLSATLKNISWQTGTAGMHKEDKNMLDALVGCVKFFAQEPHTPEHLRVDSIFFTPKGQMRTFLPLKERRSGFDFLRLREFAKDSVKSNPVLFRELVHRSSLTELPAARLFVNVLRDHLLGNPVLEIVDEVALASPRIPGITMDNLKKIWVHMTKAVGALKALRLQLFREMIPLLINRNKGTENRLHTLISEGIIAFQEEMCYEVTGFPGGEAWVKEYVLQHQDGLLKSTPSVSSSHAAP